MQPSKRSQCAFLKLHILSAKASRNQPTNLLSIHAQHHQPDYHPKDQNQADAQSQFKLIWQLPMQANQNGGKKEQQQRDQIKNTLGQHRSKGPADRNSSILAQEIGAIDIAQLRRNDDISKPGEIQDFYQMPEARQMHALRSAIAHIFQQQFPAENPYWKVAVIDDKSREK